MRPMRMAVPVAMVAALLVAAPAATAKVDLAGGATTLKLDRGTAGALADAGVAVRPLQPAKARGGAVAFPVVGGRIDPATAAGRIDHSGGLQFSKGGERVALRAFRVHVGARRAILTARVGNSRLTALSLSLKRAKVVRPGLATTVRGVRATLTAGAAKALNAAFSTGLFARGTPIGSVTVKARPAQVEARRRWHHAGARRRCRGGAAEPGRRGHPDRAGDGLRRRPAVPGRRWRAGRRGVRGHGPPPWRAPAGEGRNGGRPDRLRDPRRCRAGPHRRGERPAPVDPLARPVGARGANRRPSCGVVGRAGQPHARGRRSAQRRLRHDGVLPGPRPRQRDRRRASPVGRAPVPLQAPAGRSPAGAGVPRRVA